MWVAMLPMNTMVPVVVSWAAGGFPFFSRRRAIEFAHACATRKDPTKCYLSVLMRL
jgi:hypothetical protein